MSEERNQLLKNNPINCVVLYEDDSLVAVNKPVGVAVHSDGISSGPTMVDWLRAHAPEAQGVGESATDKNGKEIDRSGVVHRLDRDTSGVLVMVKTSAAHSVLKAQFQARTVKKEYRALVYGHFRETWGTIERAIGRSARDWRLRSAERGAKGQLREATTAWELIGQGEYEGESFAYLILKPKTGRTHQLRVHLKAIDHPIVGDVLYAGARREQSNNLGLTRLALHAHTLSFLHPETGELMRLVAPIPPEIEIAADHLHAREA